MERIFLYHGSDVIVSKPDLKYCKSDSDYGFAFYLTPDEELAKEWACKQNDKNGYVSKYSVDLSELKILDLKKYDVLTWIAILNHYRNLKIYNSNQRKAYDFLEKKYFINVDEYDVVIGYRADDSYFSLSRLFMNGTITIEQLNEALEFGELGYQYAFLSQKAINYLKYEKSSRVYAKQYYVKRQNRDILAKEKFNNLQTKRTKQRSKTLFDIMEEEK